MPIGGILVLAACTDIAVLDEALLRPGRLQHHIKLSLPNRLDIEQILDGRIKKMKCNSDVCIRELGSILHYQKNFNVTGADVENICRRALIAKIREHIALDAQCVELDKEGQLKFDKKCEYFTRNKTYEAMSHSAYEEINEIDICMRNFVEAIKECFPSSLSTDLDENKAPDMSKAEGLESFVWDGVYSVGLHQNSQ